MTDTGVLLVAHGTPTSLDDIPQFLSNIRRGRPTPQAIVDEVRRRYEVIGGRSPVLQTTRTQASLLEQRLGLPCFVATRMWHPFFEEVLRELATTSLQRLVVLAMAPHSAHVYGPALHEVADKLKQQGVRVPALHVAPCWGHEPALANAWAEATRDQLDRIDPRDAIRRVLVLSAHSLPMRVVEAGDPYPELVTQTAEAVVQALGADALPHFVAFQSQGMTTDDWIGPDLPTVFVRAKRTGASGVVVVPVGFVADHVETLYDLDIEARAIAEDLKLGFDRVTCLNDRPALIDTLEHVVRAELDKLS